MAVSHPEQKSLGLAKNLAALIVRQVHGITTLLFHLAMVMTCLETHIALHGPTAFDLCGGRRRRRTGAQKQCWNNPSHYMHSCHDKSPFNNGVCSSCEVCSYIFR